MARPIRISLLVDAARARRELKDTADRTTGLGRSIVRMAPGLHALGSGLGAAGRGLLGLAKGAAEDDSAQKTLARTLRNTVGATDAQVKSIEDYISKAGVATGITDDQMRPAFANLVRATKDVGKAQTLMGLAMDVSAGTGKDLGAVSLALAKAQNGSVGALGKLGIATKDASGKTKSFAAIQAELTKQFGGQAATAANSTAGKYKRFQLVMDELGETIGGAVLPILGLIGTFMLRRVFPAASKLSDLFESRVVPTLQRFGGFVRSRVLPAAVALAQKIAGAVVPVVRDLVAAFTPLVRDILAKAPAAFGLLKTVLSEIGQVLTGTVGPAIKSFAGFLRDNQTLVGAVAVGIGAIVVALKLYHGVLAIVTIATKAFAAVQAAVNVIMALNPIGVVVLAVIGLAAALIYAYKKSETFRRVVDGAFGAVKKAVTSVIGFFRGLPGSIARAVGDTAKTLLGKGKGLIFGIINGYNSVIRAVSTFFGGLGRKVLTWIGNTALTLRGRGANFIHGIINGYNSVIGAVARFFGGLGRSVLGWIGNTALTLVGKGKNFIHGIINGYNSVIGAVGTFFRGIPSYIVRSVGDLSRALYGAGRNVVQGLLNGITDLAGRVASAARDLASKITGPVAQFLRLGSPSRLFRQYGRWTVDGLVTGLQQQAGQAARASSQLARSVADGFGAPELRLGSVTAARGGAALAGAGAAAPIEINVYALQDGPEIGRRVVQQIRAYEQINGTGWRTP